MKYVCAIAILAVLIACNRNPFVEAKAKFSKAADNCQSVSNAIRSISNIGGERFEFQKCLPVDEQLRNVKAERKGDTVVVSFVQKEHTALMATFDVTLDIDSYPAYKYIIIDDNIYPMTKERY